MQFFLMAYLSLMNSAVSVPDWVLLSSEEKEGDVEDGMRNLIHHISGAETLTGLLKILREGALKPNEMEPLWSRNTRTLLFFSSVSFDSRRRQLWMFISPESFFWRSSWALLTDVFIFLILFPFCSWCLMQRCTGIMIRSVCLFISSKWWFP